jgi:serine/threonine protein kinase
MGTQELLGKLVGEGRYLISRCLRDGGMAAIFQGEDTTTGTPVIIKVPQLEHVQVDASFRQRFLREIQVLKKLAHPNIVRILCASEEKGVPFVVLRYLEGGALGDRMYTGPGQTARPQPPEKLADWLPTIAAVLDHIHGQNYVHRDVKPYNILFDGAGKPFLADLGIARALSPTGEGSLTPDREQPPGTRPYMAPEQIHRQKIGPYTDQFALAVVVYEWLAGRRPFAGEALDDIARAQRQPLTPLQFSLPGLPEGVSQAVSQALSINPQDRFPSCRDFANQVMAALGLAAVPKSATATVVASNPDTWSLPISEFEPSKSRRDGGKLPVAPGPLSANTASKSVTTRRDLPVPEMPVEQSSSPGEERHSPMRAVIFWSVLGLLLVLSAFAGSFFLPGTAPQRAVGQPIGSLLESVGAPGWVKAEPEEKEVPREGGNATDSGLAELQREKLKLAQKLDDAEGQRNDALKARDEAREEKKTAEDRLARLEKDYREAREAKLDAETKMKAETARADKAKEELRLVGKDKGGVAKELVALKENLEKAQEKFDAAEKARKEAEGKFAKESARATKLDEDYRSAEKARETAAKQLAEVETKLTDATKQVTAAKKDAADAKKDAADAKTNETQARGEANKLQATLKVIDDNSKRSMPCFVLFNDSGAAITFEYRSMSRTGTWAEWKKEKIPTSQKPLRFQSADGALAIQLRYETEDGPKVVDMDPQLFRVWYKLTDESVESLRKKKIPQEMLKQFKEEALPKLKAIKDREFETREAFLEQVKKRLTPAEQERFENLVLQAGKRSPGAADIDCWYGFKKTGSELTLQRVPRRQ